MSKDTAGADDEEEGDAEYAPSSTASRRHGCAGCASSGPGESLVLALAIAGLVLRRRRRAI